MVDPDEVAKKAAAVKKKAGRPRTDKALAFTAIQKVVRAVHAGTKCLRMMVVGMFLC